MAKEISDQDQPLKSADKKYYANRTGSPTSCIQRSIADSVKRPLTGNPTPRAVDPHAPQANRDALQSSDKYYANDGKAVARAIPLAPSGSTLQAVNHAQSTHPILILSEDKLAEGIANAIAQVQAGSGRVRVGLINMQLLAKARLAVEQAVTREEISEDQGRDIVFGMVNPKAIPAQLQAKPVPSMDYVSDVVQTPAPASLADMDKFVAPADDEELDRSVDTDRPVVEVDGPGSQFVNENLDDEDAPAVELPQAEAEEVLAEAEEPQVTAPEVAAAPEEKAAEASEDDDD